MHQPHKLPNPSHSQTVARVGASRQPRNQKSAPSKSMAVNQSNLQPQRVRQIRTHASIPVWLRSLLTAQKVSKILFVGVFGLSLVVYGQTMHTQTTWRTSEDQLRRWQKQERQQGIMDENLKQDLAKTAGSQGSGFVDPKPQMTVFIHGAPSRQPKSLPEQTQSPKPTPVSKVPSGY
jgi:hypothetical protein